MKIQNKNHWYDGSIYDIFIAPNQKKLFSQIRGLIEPDKKIIDVGCGTGLFSFSMVDKSKSILGIDLSERNIKKANQNLKKMPDNKLMFSHTNLQNLISEGSHHFDYAVLTYVIHEVNEEDRVPLLNDISLLADKIIIGDYFVPRPDNFAGTLTNIIEFVAGLEHYRNFKTYVANGGIPYLAKQADLSILSEINNQRIANHIVVLTKK